MDTIAFKASFSGVRLANLSRLDYFGHGDLNTGWNVAEWGCALGGECGELLNVLKKINRAAPFDPDIKTLKIKASEEIADVYLYLDLVAAKLGLDILDCVRAKFNLTSIDKGMPQRIFYCSGEE